MDSCLCGCGSEVTKQGNSFLKGHWARTDKAIPPPSFRGKHHTPETKEKMRQAQLGKIFTREHIENLSQALKGRVPWNAGMKGDPHYNDIFKNGHPMLGKPAWSRGLTKFMHSSLMSMALKMVQIHGQRAINAVRKKYNIPLDQTFIPVSKYEHDFARSLIEGKPLSSFGEIKLRERYTFPSRYPGDKQVNVPVPLPEELEEYGTDKDGKLVRLVNYFGTIMKEPEFKHNIILLPGFAERSREGEKTVREFIGKIKKLKEKIKK